MESEKPSEGKSAASNSCFPSGRFLILPEKIISIKIIPTKENIYTCKAEILRVYFILMHVKQHNHMLETLYGPETMETRPKNTESKYI